MGKSSHIHMKFIRTFLLLAGIWPIEATGIKLFLYNFYFYVSYTYYVLNVGTVYVTAKQMMYGKPTEITNYISNAVFATLLVYKAFVYRSSGVKHLLDLIRTAEKKILSSNDEDIKTIYKKNVNSTNFLGKICVYQGTYSITDISDDYHLFICRFLDKRVSEKIESINIYIASGIISSFCAQVFPLICTLMSKPDENGKKQKYFIVTNWVPFDKFEYYYTAYIAQYIFTIYAEMYTVICGTFFLYILNNIIGQLLVLQYNFSRIGENAEALCRKNGSSFKQSCNHFMNLCIEEHQSIIRLYSHLDQTFKSYIFVDYMCTSFGLSMVVLQFLLEDTLQMKIAAAGFFVVFASQSLIVYYHADTVAIQSSYGLSQAIFASDWFELDLGAQKGLPVVISRAQKPLTLSIGPLKKVGVESLIALFKATYSFLSVMW